jgi:hypothetical protein
MRWEGNVARRGDRRVAYRVLLCRAVGNRQLGRSKHRWEYRNKMDILKV